MRVQVEFKRDFKCVKYFTVFQNLLVALNGRLLLIKLTFLLSICFIYYDGYDFLC